MTKIFYIILSILLFSCGQTKDAEDKGIAKNGNVTTTISTDVSKLAKLLDLSLYKPTQVKFKYTFIDNSGQNERLSVAGPSDNYLQAILYFDTTTFKNLRTKYYSADYTSPNFEKLNFNFEWLNDEIKNELKRSDTNYHGHPDYFLGGTSKLWFLDNKILLTKSTN